MKKSTLVAVAVFVVLAVAFFVTREPRVAVGVRKLTLAPVAADAITKVELGGPAAVLLELRDGAWTVAAAGAPEARFPADEGQVKGLTAALAELKGGDFISEKAEKHAEYELDAAKGLSLKASTAGGVARDLVLGKASKSGGVYLREARGNEVFAVTGALGFQARRDLVGWRKKAISTASAGEVTRVAVTPPGGAPYALASEGGAWKLEGPAPKDFRFDAEAAQRLVRALTSLAAQGFVAAGEADDTQGPGATALVLTKKDGQAVTVRVGTKKPDGPFPVRVDGDAQGYLVAAWQAEALTKGLEGLRDLRLLTFEAAKVQRVAVSGGGKKVTVTKEGEGWKLVEPKVAPAGVDVDLAQVPAQLQRLANLRALRVAEGLTEAKAGVATGTSVELSLEGGQTVALRFGAQGGAASEVYAKGSDGLVYVATAADKAQWEQGVELFKRPPPPPSMNGMQGLDQLPPELRRQLEAQLRQQGLGP